MVVGISHTALGMAILLWACKAVVGAAILRWEPVGLLVGIKLCSLSQAKAVVCGPICKHGQRSNTWELASALLFLSSAEILYDFQKVRIDLFIKHITAV